MSAPTTSESGFSYIELLVASSLLLVSLLALSGMFVTGYSHVNGAGNSTMGLAAARQLMEDARRLPYDNLVNLHDFNTDDPNTLPDNDPEREIARRWRFALAGEGVGWEFTNQEKARWPSLVNMGTAMGAVGTITAVQRTTTLTEVSVTISVPGSWRPIRISTLIARL